MSSRGNASRCCALAAHCTCSSPEITTDSQQFVRYLIGHRITSAYIPPALLSDVASHLEQQHGQMVLTRLLVGVEPIQQARCSDFAISPGK